VIEKKPDKYRNEGNIILVLGARGTSPPDDPGGGKGAVAGTGGKGVGQNKKRPNSKKTINAMPYRDHGRGSIQ